MSTINMSTIGSRATKNADENTLGAARAIAMQVDAEYETLKRSKGADKEFYPLHAILLDTIVEYLCANKDVIEDNKGATIMPKRNQELAKKIGLYLSYNGDGIDTGERWGPDCSKYKSNVTSIINLSIKDSAGVFTSKRIKGTDKAEISAVVSPKEFETFIAQRAKLYENEPLVRVTRRTPPAVPVFVPDEDAATASTTSVSASGSSGATEAPALSVGVGGGPVTASERLPAAGAGAVASRLVAAIAASKASSGGPKVNPLVAATRASLSGATGHAASHFRTGKAGDRSVRH